MRFTQVIFAATTVTLMGALPTFAQQKIYAYKSSHNFCAAGSQPVTYNGEISCGVPSEKITYQQVLQHPVRKRHKVRHVRRADCAVGTKGCTFD